MWCDRIFAKSSKGCFSIVVGVLSYNRHILLQDDLLSIRTDKWIRAKITRNPLKNFILNLADLMETYSRESQDLQTKKQKQGPGSNIAASYAPDHKHK
jgi:hypothetical protein